MGNLKTMMLSAYQVLKHRKYAKTYLGAYVYLLNHQLNLRDMIVRLSVDAAWFKPVPNKVIRGGHAEAGFQLHLVVFYIEHYVETS